jgi:hypothetical protein
MIVGEQWWLLPIQISHYTKMHLGVYCTYFLTICSLSKMGKLKYLSGGQNKNNIYSGINTLIFFMFCLLWSTIVTGKMM